MGSKESMKSFGIGLLLGTVAGGILGILYAPHSGKLTRGIVDEKVHDAIRRAERIIKEAKDKAQDVIKEAKSKI